MYLSAVLAIKKNSLHQKGGWAQKNIFYDGFTFDI